MTHYRETLIFTIKNVEIQLVITTFSIRFLNIASEFHVIIRIENHSNLKNFDRNFRCTASTFETIERYGEPRK